MQIELGKNTQKDGPSGDTKRAVMNDSKGYMDDDEAFGNVKFDPVPAMELVFQEIRVNAKVEE